MRRQKINKILQLVSKTKTREHLTDQEIDLLKQYNLIPKKHGQTLVIRANMSRDIADQLTAILNKIGVDTIRINHTTIT